MNIHAHDAEISGSGHEMFADGPESNGKSHKPFFTKHTPVRYSRSRVVDVLHIKLVLSFDLEKRKLIGTAHLTFSPITDDVDSLTLDACDMEIGKVKMGSRNVMARSEGEKLELTFDRALKADKAVTVSIPYTVTDPRAGLYFIAPDEHYPDKPVEIWTQGQDEDSRYWFPCFDYPNEKATTEVIATVPAIYTTLSNGKLISVKKKGRDKVYHWRHDVPHVAYLVTLVVGDFVEVKDSWDGIPVTYFCHPGDEKRAKNAFGKTPAMVKFFSEKIGVRYPYAKYSQIAVTDFIFGGMENTTATTQTALTLHDNRARLDISSEPLVSHELAHQWFGDLITCRDWSHGWLNEGFTTYMECCWLQKSWGNEEFLYYMLQKMEGYQEEDKSSYRRPIVCNRYLEPIDLFDRHLYEKGACVMHTLRFMLGEKLFWKALKLYTERYAGRCVITQDWASAIEDATGRNLDEFFNQWIYGGGHPEFKIGFSYDGRQKLGTLTVKQTQETDDLTAIFKLPVQVAFTSVSRKGRPGRREEHTIKVERGEQSFNLPLNFRPDFVTFDVGNWITKTLDLSGLPEVMLRSQLAHDSDPIGRVHAARELGKRGSSGATTALRGAVKREGPWFVQAESARALGTIGSDAARRALLATLQIDHPKARRAVVAALGEFRNEGDVARALKRIISKGDASYLVEASACLSLGKTRDADARKVLTEVLKSRESHNNIVRSYAISGLVALEDTAALKAIRKRCLVGVPANLRQHALQQLGQLAKLAGDGPRREIRKFLEETLEENNFFVSIGAIFGLAALGDPESSTALRRKAGRATDSRIKSRAEKTATALAAKTTAPRQMKELRDELREIKKQNSKLTERLEKLEALKVLGNGVLFTLSHARGATPARAGAWSKRHGYVRGATARTTNPDFVRDPRWPAIFQ